MGAYFCMGAYKRDVVVVIRMGAYIHGVLILCGCLLSRFYGMSFVYYVVHRSIACWCIGYHGCRQWDVVGSGCACNNITHNHRCMITS